MSQIKMSDIKARLELFNKMIGPQGIFVNLEGRYGYQALDLYRITKPGEPTEMLSTVATGMTRRETYERVNAMIDGVKLYTYKTPKYY